MPNAPQTFFQKYLGGTKATNKAYAQHRRRNPRLRAADEVHRSRRWKKVRDLKKTQARYLCEECLKHGKLTDRGLHCHHVIHPFLRPDLAYSLENPDCNRPWQFGTLRPCSG